ncbi:retrotransposon protein, putative, ty1-copia subclass [Tanacetum coccineum]
MKNYVELKCLGYVIPQELSVGLILNGLTTISITWGRQLVNYMLCSLSMRKGPKKAETPQVLMIRGGKIQKANKKSLNAKGNNKVKGKGKDKKVYIPKPKNPKPTAMERPTKDDACHHCKEVGHWKRNCHVYLAELLKKEKQVGSTSSSVRAQVEAIGSFDLVLPNGLVICLDNCHYAPTITRGVVSVSHLVDNGFVQCFTDYGISVSKNDVLYFNAIALVMLTPPYTPQHNGVSERRNRTLLDMVRSMMNLTTLPLSFLGLALELQHAIQYEFPTKKVDKTPYECEISERAVDLEEIQEEEDTILSKITNNIPQEVEGFEPPQPSQEEVIPIRRSKRTHPESKKWVDAMNAEMQSMIDNMKMDVKTTFLNGYLDEDIYMVQHEGFVDPKHPRKVCKLQRSIYGLKQASRSWNKRFDKEIKKFGFDQNLDEPCVYQKASGSNVTFLVLYVDAIIIMGNHIPSLQSVKNYLGKCFSMKDLGEAAFILGIKIYRDRSKRLIRLSQNAYMDKILKRYRMDNSKRGTIPMQEKLDLNKSQGAQTPKEVNHMKNVPFASVVGSIMYAVRCIRTDVVFAQNLTSWFQQNPGELHWTAVKNILKYLRNTKDMFLVYGGNPSTELRVECAVDWKSSKQSTTAMSATESEYIAASEAVMEAVWIRKFISGLSIVPMINEPLNMYCDNSAAIHYANEPGV